MMRKRIYHRFPHRTVEFEQKYRYHSDLPFFVKVMANMDGKFGMFVTESVTKRGHRIQAKREIGVEIVANGIDFSPLNYDTVEGVLDTLDPEGIVDFRIHLRYSYLDGKYNRVPFRGDIYLVRAILEHELLVLQINHIDGPKRTECGRVADTIIDELRRGS
ncbi:MAG: hypothetical protein PWQ51_348 [Methanolobus sp.]|uniref:Uncharacterized protein n=2 Tax=Methanolobus TaxID=2220 RepID=W9DTE1_METTI|nr:hypothetical protein [Methanolobus tindarius]ETA68910.1 hypothetical protein MettiDRAFT_2399 [Methanolobus tindarius DSM 2278]MDI3486422.1 hypothetical protein [Methanolobus sp.]MDK2938184.1 hypothetical protein [Methanolobus sp.]